MNLSSKNQSQSLVMMKVVCHQATSLEKEQFFTALLQKPALRKSYWELKTLDRLLKENKSKIWLTTQNAHSSASQEMDIDIDIDDDFILAYSQAQNELKQSINLNI